MKEWFFFTLPKYTAVTNIKSNFGKEINQYKTKKKLEIGENYKIIFDFTDTRCYQMNVYFNS